MKNKSPVKSKDVRNYLENILGNEWHAKRILSMSNATLGVIQASALSVSAIGKALAAAEGLCRWLRKSAEIWL